jgi:Tfp pilus assembly protein PilX
MDGMEAFRHPEPVAPAANERGAALLLAIFVLTTLAIVALYLGSQAQINRRIAGDDVLKSKALHSAEAGVYEAIARIQAGQGPNPLAVNPALKVVQVLNTTTPGTAGADTTLLATGQPTGQWLPYSTATRGAGALTIEFKTNPARTVVYKYDKSVTPPIQTGKGSPIYHITSTARVASAKRTIVADVCWNPVINNIKGALASGTDVKFSGNAISCGHDHRADTPAGTGANGRTGPGGCNEDPGASPPKWEIASNTVPGIWCGGDASPTGAANAFGTPPVSNYNSPFYAGPWEPLGMTQAQFWSWVGSPLATLPGSPNGTYYLDNDATKQNASGAWSLTSGSGFLYVDGDLTLQDNWRGLIYIEGDMKLNGNAWILGAVICKGINKVDFLGGATILYSYEAVVQTLQNVHWRKPAVLSWKEQ